MVTERLPLQPERSFLGPTRATWGDRQRLRYLRLLAAVIRERISQLNSLRERHEHRKELQSAESTWRPYGTTWTDWSLRCLSWSSQLRSSMVTQRRDS